MKRLALLVMLVASTAACSSSRDTQAPTSSRLTSTTTNGGRATTTTSAAPIVTISDAPTLGLPFRVEPQRSWQRGYGTVHPSTIDGGGDEGSVVGDIHWQSWGSAMAIGSGTAAYVAPNQIMADATSERATVVAFKLGTCHGRRAYDAVEWFFPQHGERFNLKTYVDSCFADQSP